MFANVIAKWLLSEKSRPILAAKIVDDVMDPLCALVKVWFSPVNTTPSPWTLVLFNSAAPTAFVWICALLIASLVILIIRSNFSLFGLISSGKIIS